MFLRQYRRFTLIELLVVISIIGILMTILLPVLKKAKENGQRIFCQSNMKQIAVAACNYAGDFDDIMPKRGDVELTVNRIYHKDYNPSFHSSLHYFIEDYLRVPLKYCGADKYAKPVRGYDTPLHCPGAKMPDDSMLDNSAIQYTRISYTMWGFSESDGGGFSVTPRAYQYSKMGKALKFDNKYYDKVMLGEPISPETYYNGLGKPYYYLNHALKGSNIAYFDGRVQWIPISEINYKAPTIPVPDGSTCLGQKSAFMLYDGSLWRSLNYYVWQ